MAGQQYRRRTAGGIPYALMEGYPKISGDDEKTTATEKYVMAASNVAAFFAESMPQPIVYLNFTVLPPRRRMPGTGYLVTKTLDYEPFSGQLPGDPLGVDTDAPSGTYDDTAVVTIKYETSQESDDDERDEESPETFLEHSITAGSEYLSVPPNKTTVETRDVDNQPSAYGAGDAAEEEDNKDPGMPILWTIPTIEHSLKWKFVLEPDWQTIFARMGTVNSVAVPVFFDAKVETVLFMGVSGSQSYTWHGGSVRVQPWSLDFKFSQRTITEENRTFGWNHAYSPVKGEWVRIKRATGQPLYELADHRDLFKSNA